MSNIEAFFDYLLIQMLPFWTEFFDLIVGIAWPLALFLAAKMFKVQISALISRIRRFSATGAEFYQIGFRGTAGRSDTEIGELKKLPGIERTPAISEVEETLHRNISEYPEEDRLDVALRELAQARLDFHFCNVYRVIFGSQIRLLRMLRERGGSIPLPEVEVFFVELQEKHEEHRDHRAQDYLSFLVGNRIIEINAGTVSITQLGSDFLFYLFRFSLSEDRPI